MVKYFCFIFLLLTSQINADCDFDSAEFLDKLTQPEEIKSITVDVYNNKKYTKNFYKLILSSKDTIPPKFKKILMELYLCIMILEFVNSKSD